MGDSKVDPKLWAVVTIVTTLILCIGTVVAASLSSPAIEKLVTLRQPQVTVVVIATPTIIVQEDENIPNTLVPSTLVPPTATQVPIVETYEVFANLTWQNTGILIDSDDRIRVIWDGNSRWRGINSGDFSDPLGGYIDTSDPEYVCQPLMPHEEAGWNALVAKIGENGIPTNPFKNDPTGQGYLYLAMNDCDSERYDNEGSVNVTIEIND